MQRLNLRLHESCMENRSIRSLDAIIAGEVDVNGRDKVCHLVKSCKSIIFHLIFRMEGQLSLWLVFVFQKMNR